MKIKLNEPKEEELLFLFGSPAIERAISLSDYEWWLAEQAKKVAAKKALRDEARGVVPLSELRSAIAMTKEELEQLRIQKAKKKHLQFVKFIQEQRRIQWTWNDDRALRVLKRRKIQIRKKMKLRWLNLFAKNIARALVMFGYDVNKATLEFENELYGFGFTVELRVGKRRIDITKLLSEYDKVRRIVREVRQYKFDYAVEVKRKTLEAKVRVKYNGKWYDCEIEDGKVIVKIEG